MSTAIIRDRPVDHQTTIPTPPTRPAASVKDSLVTLPGVPGMLEVLAVQSQR